IVFAEVRTDGTCPDTYTLTRTWTATDNCGNASTGTQVITVQDTTAPTFNKQPDAIADLSCSDELPVPETLTASDNCSTATIVASVDPFTANKCTGYSVIHRWTATDRCGNSTEQTITFKVLPDTQAPVFDVLPTAIADIPCSEKLPVQQTLTASDNCGTATVVASVDPFMVDQCAGYPVTYRWKATDECGNVAEQTITFNVLPDIQAPVFDTAPTPIADLSCNDELPAQETLTATDNCGTVTVSASIDPFVADKCTGYSVKYRWTATDNCKNSSEQTVTFKVLPDTQAPVFDTAPTAITDLSCGDELPVQETLTATDNCGTATVVASIDPFTADKCAGYPVTYRWTATDECGNSTEKTVVFNILPDKKAPDFVKFPADTTVVCGEIPDVAIIGTHVIANDNCKNAPLIIYNGENTTAGICPELYIITRKWTTSDECGNSSEKIQTITVKDLEAPQFVNFPANDTLECSSLSPILPDIEVVDDCDANVQIDFKEEQQDINCPSSYTLKRTWTATDDCGNSKSQSQIIVLRDTTVPMFDKQPNPISDISCSESLPVQEILTAFDNCGTAVVTASVDPYTEDKCNGYAITYRWRATDECGNYTDLTQPFNVLPDKEKPVFNSEPSPISDISCEQGLPVQELLTATDNCGTATVVASIDPFTKDLCKGYAVTYRWTATDDCGNSSEKTVSFTILPDTKKPEFVNLPSAMSPIQFDQPIPEPEVLSATDNCGAVTVIANIDPYTPDECTGFDVTYRWRATDECGNVNEVTQILTVLPDKQAPEFTSQPKLIADINAYEKFPEPEVLTAMNGDIAMQITATIDPYVEDVCNGYKVTYRWTAADKCGNTTEVTQSFNVLPDVVPPVFTSPPSGIDNISCGDSMPVQEILTAVDNGQPVEVIASVDKYVEDRCNGNTITYRWTAIDRCNNKTIVTQSFQILPDNSAPNFVWFPEDLSAECGSLPAVPEIGLSVLADDACSGNAPITYLGESRTNEVCPNTYTLLRTWSATDNCGNVKTQSQKIFVTDNTPPTASPLPNTGPFACLNDIPKPNPEDVVNEADNCGGPILVEFMNDEVQAGCSGIVTRTYRVSDGCENSIELKQLISIDDRIAPAASALPELGPFSCYSEIPPPNTDDVKDEQDNCAGPVTVSFVSDSENPGCSGTVTRIYKLEDGCGNSSELIQLIRIDNKMAPTADPLPNIGPFNCMAEIPANIEHVTGEKAYCGGNVIVEHVADTDDPGCSGVVTRTYRLTDECGNTSDLQQLITIENKALPEVEALPQLGPFTCYTDIPAPVTEGFSFSNIVCKSNITITHKGDTGNPGCSGKITRTYAISDECGNSVEVTQDIIIENKVLPIADPMPDLGPFQCYALIPAGNIEDVKNETAACGKQVTVTLAGDTGDPGCKGMIIRKYRLEDDCGNISEVNQIIYVDNTESPVMKAPEDIIVDNSSLVPLAHAGVAAFISAGGIITDACGINESSFTLLLEQSDGNENPEIITRTYQISDQCGNTTICTQKITVLHDSKPEIISPENVTVECFDDIPPVYASLDAFKTDGGTVSGVCEINNASFRLVKEEIEEIDCSYFVSRIYEIADVCGSRNTCEHILMSRDITMPVLEGSPGDLHAECEAPAPYASYSEFREAGGLINDNCKINETSFRLLEETNDGKTCPNLITRTYQVADYCNNLVSYTQQIRVEDTTPPEMVCIPRLTIDASAKIPPTHENLKEFIANGASVSDNCGLDSLSFKLSDEQFVEFPDSVTISRTYEIADSCGNVSSCVWHIKQLKYIIPYMLPPDNLTTTYSKGIPTAYPSIDEMITAGGKVESYCGINVGSFLLTSQASDNQHCPETYTRTYQITDSCGVNLTCQQKIVITDDTPPEMAAPRDTTVDSRLQTPSILHTLDAFELAGGEVYDDDQINRGSFRFITETSNTGENEITLFRVYEISDRCGNVKASTHTIRVKNIKTQVSGAGDFEVECISQVPAPYTTFDQYVAAGAIIISTCEIDKASFKLETETSDLNICPTIITRTYSFMDKCGELLRKDQKITVMDKTNPVFINKPGDLTVHCGVPAPYSNLSQFRSGGGEITDNCKLNESSFSLVSETSNGTGCYVQYYRIYSISDVCGNIEYYHQNIIISDKEAPRFGTNLQEMTVTCEAPAPWNNYNSFVAAGGNVSDNCGMDNNSFKLVDEEVNGTQCPIEIIRTYVASDNCGNVGTFKNKITVIDDEYPKLVVPGSSTIPDGEEIPEAFRNYSGFIAAGGSASDNCKIEEQSFTLKKEDVIYSVYTDSIFRWYEISDHCKNASAAKHVIIIERDSVPFLASPPDMIFSCRSQLPSYYTSFEDFQTAGGRGATNCNFISSTFRMTSQKISSGSCPEIVTRIYEITDDCGKTAKTTHRIIINDQLPPLISGKNTITFGAITDIPAVYSNLEAFIADGGTVSDNCGIQKETFRLVSEKSQFDDCPFSVTRIYAIADSCGNQRNFTQVFTINDQQPPQMTAPGNLTLDCIDTLPPAFANYTDFIAAGGKITDNTLVEENSFTLLNEETVSAQGTRQIVRTYRIADRCGNTGTAQYIIQSSDNVAPVATCNPIMISLDTNGKYELTSDNILQITLGSHDDCTPVAGLKYMVSPSTFDCSMISDIQDLTVTVTDEYGNSSQCKTTAVVLDNYIPVISCRDIELFLDENGQALLSPEMITTVESENCSIDTMFVDRTQFSCAQIGSQSVQVTVRDNTNVIFCSATVTITDTIAPRVTSNTLNLVIDDSGKALLTDVLLSTVLFDACGIRSYEPDKTEFTCADIGENTVHIKVTDSNSNSISADLIVVVSAGNSEPQALDDATVTIMDTPIRIGVLANDRDPDGALNPSSLNVIQMPLHGSIQINSANEIIYSPDNGFTGSDNLKYVICDDGIPCITLCDTAIVSISVLKPNIAPVAVDDHFTSGCDMISANVLNNDHDIDGHVIQVKTKLISNPKYGVVTISGNGEFTYIFPYGFSGNDSFVYQICDNALDAKCGQATVFINIFADKDCDGIDDRTDMDDDNDGITDATEGNGSSDKDSDGVPDSQDIDSDNDGILDNTEAQDESQSVSLSGADANGDGLDDAYQPSGLSPVDADADGIPDYLDDDSDNDHVSDHIEGYDSSSSGIPSAIASGMDDDLDGLDNAFDPVDARTKNSSSTNPAESGEILQNTDNDGIRDWRDPDDDNDGMKTKFEDLNNNSIYSDDDLDMDGHPEYLDTNDNCTLFIPEGFSPDGDGVHDYFQIYCIDSYPNAKMMVFDRQGILLYSKDHYGNLEFWGSYEDSWWNGAATLGPNANKKVSPEIYLYIFEFGNGKSQRGFVMVSY
ncbi:MAG TPA: hypothetical protein DD458_10605, partial [Prolixibacteraceae bacterium]|nr:hypothetical protein [Prolixibacteraceae bacterium]